MARHRFILITFWTIICEHVTHSVWGCDASSDLTHFCFSVIRLHSRPQHKRCLSTWSQFGLSALLNHHQNSGLFSETIQSQSCVNTENSMLCVEFNHNIHPPLFSRKCINISLLTATLFNYSVWYMRYSWRIKIRLSLSEYDACCLLK